MKKTWQFKKVCKDDLSLTRRNKTAKIKKANIT